MRKLSLIFALVFTGIVANATNILTPSGYKDLSAVTIGDSVIAYDIVDGHIIYNQIEAIEPLNADWFIAQGDSNFTWYLINSTYKIFKYQSIWNTPTSCVHGFELQVGDTIYNDLNNNVAVTSITETTADSAWIRLEISGDHSFISEGITLHNASRFWVTGGTDNNWSTTGNWSTGSGGAGGSSVPVVTDDVTLDHAGNSNCTLNTSARTCKTLTVEAGATAYHSTLTFNQNLTVAGNITLGDSMVFAGSSTLICSATATLTSNGKTFPGSLTFSGANTFTLADDWTVSNALSFNSAAIVNGNTLNIGGNISSGSSAVSGSTAFNFNGTGTWVAGTLGIKNDFTINTSGTLTLSGVVRFTGGTLTYIAGTVVTTGSTLAVVSTATLNTDGVNWETFNCGSTVTLLSDLTCVNITSRSDGSVGIINGYNVRISGNIDFSTQTSNNFSGTANLIMTGTGFIKSGTTTGTIYNNLEINTSGTITMSGTVNYGTGNFKYTAGTMASGGTLNFKTVSPSITLNAVFVFAGTISTAVATTFNGTNGFTISNYSCTTAGITNTFAAGKTYTVTGALTLTGTSASHVSVVSSSSGTQAILKLSQGATQDVGFVNATDIDSRSGLTVWNFKGTNSNASNWNSLTEAAATATTGRIF